MPRTTLPVSIVDFCPIARTAVLVAPPIPTPSATVGAASRAETDLIVVLVGALGTHYMIWRESPAAWDGPPPTAIHHVRPELAAELTSEIAGAHGVPRDLLIDDVALAGIVVESAGRLGEASGTIARLLHGTIVTACRAAISADE